eukprot:TRINITY_DN4760_c0_g1_i3.p4 TRINITY_DN4760_c0_g1~~TRINITY_DN4760_c0_g1_i3.p4  ORF type:complete len:193 (+),score=6.99 TRINITY_DN4760_c0_g1_i3:1544-2122(+)
MRFLRLCAFALCSCARRALAVTAVHVPYFAFLSDGLQVMDTGLCSGTAYMQWSAPLRPMGAVATPQRFPVLCPVEARLSVPGDRVEMMVDLILSACALMRFGPLRELIEKMVGGRFMEKLTRSDVVSIPQVVVRAIIGCSRPGECSGSVTQQPTGSVTSPLHVDTSVPKGQIHSLLSHVWHLQRFQLRYPVS